MLIILFKIIFKTMQQTSNIQYCTKQGHEDNLCNLVCINKECIEHVICGICSVEEHQYHNLMTDTNFVDKINKNIDDEENLLISQIEKTKKKLLELEDTLRQNANKRKEKSIIMRNIDDYIENLQEEQVQPSFIITHPIFDPNKIIISDKVKPREFYTNAVIKNASNCLLILISAYGMLKGTMNFCYVGNNDNLIEISIRPKHAPHIYIGERDLTVITGHDKKVWDLLEKTKSFLTYSHETKSFTTNSCSTYGNSKNIVIMVPATYD